MWPLIAAGAALGAAKSISGNMQAADERARQAAIAKYSPWTGMQAHSVQDENMFGNMLTGAAGGAVLGQGLKTPTTPDPSSIGAGSSAATGGDLMAKSGITQSPYGLMGAQNPAMAGSAGALGGTTPPAWANILNKSRFSTFGQS